MDTKLDDSPRKMETKEPSSSEDDLRIGLSEMILWLSQVSDRLQAEGRCKQSLRIVDAIKERLFLVCKETGLEQADVPKSGKKIVTKLLNYSRTEAIMWLRIHLKGDPSGARANEYLQQLPIDQEEADEIWAIAEAQAYPVNYGKKKIEKLLS